MSVVFKNKFMEKIKLFLENENSTFAKATVDKKIMDVELRRKLYNKSWVVYAKQPFAGPKQVIEYLGRYSHKIAISNHRIKNVSDGKVSFSYKDYAHGSVQKIMTLDAEEFLRRFCLHILPPKFMKIRHYGILASRLKPKLRIQQMKLGIIIQKTEKKDWKEIAKTKLNFDVDICPCCKTGKMIRIMSFDANAPPIKFLEQLEKQKLQK